MILKTYLSQSPDQETDVISVHQRHQDVRLLKFQSSHDPLVTAQGWLNFLHITSRIEFCFREF